ncbi:integrase arm-type DNA-binding domain-containing protein [Escherichia coli]
MAVLTPPLSASEVQKAKPAAKDYELFDGQGLTLFVRTTGKKIWRFRYKRPGSTTRTTITLGYYPVMSLASARTLHAEKLALLVQGVDPGKQAREAAAQEKIATDSLFINVATKWFALKKPEAFQMSMRTISGNRWKRMCFRPSGRHRSRN